MVVLSTSSTPGFSKIQTSTLLRRTLEQNYILNGAVLSRGAVLGKCATLMADCIHSIRAYCINRSCNILNKICSFRLVNEECVNGL